MSAKRVILSTILGVVAGIVCYLLAKNDMAIDQAMMAGMILNFGAGISGNPLVGLDPVYQVAEQQLRVIALSDIMEFEQVAAKHLGALDKVDLVAAVGDRQRSGHPGNAAADHQRRRAA